jgi:hypothetical protein
MFALPPAFLEGADMALYYFDLRDGEELALDEEGLELRTMRAVQEEAARALSGIAYDAMRLDGRQRQHMAIEVRDVHGPVMEVKFSFEIARKH